LALLLLSLCLAVRETATPSESGPDRDSQAIHALLLSDPVCEDIVVYLNTNTRAVDTPRGIAEWWIDRDARLTEEALNKLMSLGVVQAHVHGPATIFGYTKDRAIRRVIARYVRSLNREPAPGAAH